MKVRFNPEDAALFGIDAADTEIELPEGFDQFTPEQRRTWARKQMEAIALEMLDDIGRSLGKAATPAQRKQFLQNIAPGVDKAVRGRPHP